jgi:hypothetical protein
VSSELELERYRTAFFPVNRSKEQESLTLRKNKADPLHAMEVLGGEEL